MKKTTLLLILLPSCIAFAAGAQRQGKAGLPENAAAGLPAATALAQGSPREEICFNFGWKFCMGNPVDAKNIALDDSRWRDVDLPHDFQIEMPWDKTARGNRGFKQMGDAWYRKTFEANPEWKGRRILLDVEGIMYVGDVYFNEKFVGKTDYGYLGFDADVTELVRYGGKNVVAVYCSTQAVENSRWYTGGGLYRDVHLVLKDTVSVARNGVFVTTPTVTDSHAEVCVLVEVEGLRGRKSSVAVEARIFAPDGTLVGQSKAAAPAKTKKRTEEILLPAVSVASPQRWSCETPSLYTAEITLTGNGKVTDKVTEQFGVRTLEFSKDFGFKLNGKKVFLKGVANHHDLGAVGVAAYDRAIERYFKRLKEFGYNHVRTSHNPYSKSFLRLADKHGILITDELFDKWDRQHTGGRTSFAELWYKAIPEWVKRDRNHPSVVLWSLGNELQIVEGWTGFPTGDWGVTGYQLLDVLLKRYDPTRPTTVAMFPARANAVTKEDPDFNVTIQPPELATITDVASFNYRYLNYQDYLKRAPSMIIYQSEATSNELLAPYFGMDRARMVGLAYWGAVEYWGESSGYPRKGWAYSFFNHALEPFPQAYLIKSAFSGEPLVRIGVADDKSETKELNDIVVGKIPVSSHWNRQEGKPYDVYTYTNAEEVELLVNGKSIGTKKNDTTAITKRNVIVWEKVPYSAGSVTAIARNAGKEAARHTLETTGKAVALKLEVENPADWHADGLDLQYVKVYAVDKKGRTVPATGGEVTFEVSGAARLIAVDNGDHSSDELFAGNKRTLHNGFAMAILRSSKAAGAVKVKATAKGLKSAEKTMSSKQ
jgi:beta-galactosidase